MWFGVGISWERKRATPAVEAPPNNEILHSSPTFVTIRYYRSSFDMTTLDTVSGNVWLKTRFQLLAKHVMASSFRSIVVG